jgi:DNA-binding PadR family transcriptional regulator
MNWQWGFPFDFPGFGPEGAWGRGRGPKRGFFRAGEVRLALLSLLAEAPGHGYDLMKRLEERSGRLYNASAGTVYPVLQQLEDEGLVRSSEQAGKRVYEITDAGRTELGSADDAIDAIWSRADRWREWGGHMGPDTIEVALALGRLAKTAFTIASSGSTAGAERVVEQLNLTRRELEEMKKEDR